MTDHSITNTKTGETVIVAFTEEEEASREVQAQKDGWGYIRSKRNRLLQESDMELTVDRDESRSDSDKQAWRVYRQALRDFPTTVTDSQLDPRNWPTPPE
jgi:hypothetical protein